MYMRVPNIQNTLSFEAFIIEMLKYLKTLLHLECDAASN